MSDSHKPYGAGRSSIEFVDIDLVFQNLPFTPSAVFLDLGCGRGSYTMAVARFIGQQGIVYGIDAWQKGLEELTQQAASEGLHNIITVHANLNEHIPLEDASADICFMAAVFHDLLRESSGETVLTEIARVLRPGGRLGIIEFKKIDGTPGPPLDVRLSPDRTEEIITSFGFIRERITDVGPFTYFLAATLAKQ